MSSCYMQCLNENPLELAECCYFILHIVGIPRIFNSGIVPVPADGTVIRYNTKTIPSSAGAAV
jgi:hypothetical protein